MSSLNSSGVGATNFSYDKNGSLTTTTLASGITETITLDALNRHTGLAVKNTTTGTEVYSNNKTYTAAGNLLSTAISNAGLNPITETYVHDSMDRTTGVQSTIAGAIGDYSYDSTGNITKINQNVVTNDTLGRPLNVGNKTLGYDTLGHRTSETVTTGVTGSETTATRDLVWNADDTLAEAGNESGGTTHAAYTYSPDGLISERIEDGVTSDFVWDSTSENALLLSDGEYEYIYGPNRVPLAQVKLADNTMNYLHTAQNGSVVAVTGSNGVLIGQTNYTAFGEQIGVSYSRFGFAGEWSDKATGYTYLRARWYDSKTASFLSIDPALQTTSGSYGYANGNPLTRIDPSGLFSLTSLNPLNYVKQQIIDPIATKIDNGIRKAQEAIGSVNKAIGSGVTNGLEAIGNTTGDIMGKVVSAGATAVKNVGEWAKTVDWDAVATNVGIGLAVAGTTAAFLAFAIGTGGTGFALLGAISFWAGAAGTTISGVQTYNNCTGDDKSGCASSAVGTGLGLLPFGFLTKSGRSLSKIANTKNYSSGGTHVLQAGIDSARKSLVTAGYLSVNYASLAYARLGLLNNYVSMTKKSKEC